MSQGVLPCAHVMACVHGHDDSPAGLSHTAHPLEDLLALRLGVCQRGTQVTPFQCDGRDVGLERLELDIEFTRIGLSLGGLRALLQVLHTLGHAQSGHDGQAVHWAQDRYRTS